MSGDSGSAALILKRVGAGLYVKSTVRVETSFSTAQLANFIETVLDPGTREVFVLVRKDDYDRTRGSAGQSRTSMPQVETTNPATELPQTAVSEQGPDGVPW